MCEPGEVPIERVRLRYLEDIEKLVLQMHAIWAKSPEETQNDEVVLGLIVDELMLLVSEVLDEEGDWDE